MEHCGAVARPTADGASRQPLLRLVVLAVLLLPALPASGQPGGLFTAAGPAWAASALGVAPTPRDDVTLRQRVVTIDLDQLHPPGDAALQGGAASGGSPQSGVLTLNLFDDVVFTALIARTAPTFSGGQSLSGELAGVEMGTMTLVVNGDVVAGTVRTPDATYRIRPAGGGLHTVSQVDLARLPPLGEPIPREWAGEAPPAEPGRNVAPPPR